jgi:dienelactone hydrolase
MRCRAVLSLPTLLLAVAFARAADADPTRVWPAGQLPADARLGAPTTLNDYFPWIPPAHLPEWEVRKKELREQVLVATGLWPMPPKQPLKPVINGKIDRDDYTIEKVFFTSYPGHYVTGNLYRPKGKSGRLPGVLCPHGHWANGRFYDAGEQAAHKQIDKGAEKTIEGARYPLQARCAQLARMGCVVFHYDMVGYADSRPIAHREGFTDADAELRLQSFMGLQTFNSIRALDFLLSLPDVDPRRVGVTGASGGGTQTFILCAVDDRPAAAFPAVMVSTAMQGGCVCENCSYLRQGTGNIELAALFAPKPLGMSGANDWTIHIESRGLPELRALYELYGAGDRVLAKCFPQFEHNYNQVSRELMYNWFNRHLKLGQPEPVVERPFQPVPPRELSVFDEQHPRPKEAADAFSLRRYLTETSDRQLQALRPSDAEDVEAFRRVLLPALRVMIHDELPKTGAGRRGGQPDAAPEVEANEVRKSEERDGVQWHWLTLGRTSAGEQVPAVGLRGPSFNGTVVVWVHPRGKASLWQGGQLVPGAREILAKNAAILAPDVFGTGEFAPAKARAVDPKYAGFTFGYNRPLVAERVHDILTAVAYARYHKGTRAVHLVGLEEAGPWVLLARGLCGDKVMRTAADMNQFRFENVRTTGDPMMLPGALKYGGLPALAALAVPGELFVHNHQGTGSGQWLKTVYDAAGAPDRLQRSPEKVAPEKVVAWLLR